MDLVARICTAENWTREDCALWQMVDTPPPPAPCAHHLFVRPHLLAWRSWCLLETTDRIGSIHNMGALSLNTSSLKSQLKRECSAWKSKYCQNLHRQAKDNLESLTEYMRVRGRERVNEDPCLLLYFFCCCVLLPMCGMSAHVDH